jgi:hypothetical protein
MRPTGYGAAGVRWPPRFNHSPPWRDDQYHGIEYAGLPVPVSHELPALLRDFDEIDDGGVTSDLLVSS